MTRKHFRSLNRQVSSRSSPDTFFCTSGAVVLVTQRVRCKRQVSLTAGTLFDNTKLPLTTWFLAIYFLTQSKNGILAATLKRKLGRVQIGKLVVERDASRTVLGRCAGGSAWKW